MSHVTSMSHVCNDRYATWAEAWWHDMVGNTRTLYTPVGQMHFPHFTHFLGIQCIIFQFRQGRTSLLWFHRFHCMGYVSWVVVRYTRMFTVDCIVHADNKDSRYMGCAVNCGSNLKHGPSFCQFSAEEGAIRGNLDTYRRSRLSRLGYQEPTFHRRVSW